MATPDEDSGTSEATRWNDQHAYMTTALDFLLHPTVQAALPDLAATTPDGTVHIADVVCGTGIFLEDLAAELAPPSSGTGSELASVPRYGLDGFDADGSNFPRYANGSSTSSSLSPRFYVADITNPQFLDERRDKYQIVTVRLLHAKLRREQWEIVVKNLVSLLAPGGWLQWTDWDPFATRIAALRPGASDTELRTLLRQHTDTLRSRGVSTTHQIPQALADHLVDADSDMYSAPPQLEFTRNLARGLVDFLECDAEVFSPQEARDRHLEVQREINAAEPLLWCDLWCHTARKPVREPKSIVESV